MIDYVNKLLSFTTTYSGPIGAVGALLFVVGFLSKKKRRRRMMPGFFLILVALLSSFGSLLTNIGLSPFGSGGLLFGDGAALTAQEEEAGEPMPQIRYADEKVLLPEENQLLIIVSGYDIRIDDTLFEDADTLYDYLLSVYTDDTQVVLVDDYAMNTSWSLARDTLESLAIRYLERELK